MKTFILMLFLPGISIAGTHVMYGDVLTGGATSYIQNRSSVQSATFHVTSGTVAGSFTVSGNGEAFKWLPFDGFNNPILSVSGFGFYLPMDLGGPQGGGYSTLSGELAIYSQFDSPTLSVGPGGDVVLGAKASSGPGTIGLNPNGSTIGIFQGFSANTSASVDDLWTLPVSDRSGYWKSDGTHGLSIVDIFSSTNTWTAAIGFPSKTLAQLQALNASAGWTFYCSNCTRDTLCTSTGGVNSVVAVSSRTISCL